MLFSTILKNLFYNLNLTDLTGYVIFSVYFKETFSNCRAAVKRARLETLVASLYGSLSKRLPPSTASASNVKTMASWLFSWYDINIYC
jgi:hypothetical protein